MSRCGWAEGRRTVSQHDRRRLLGIYLNDQLALSIAWRELARRTLRENRGDGLAEELTGLVSEFAEDVRTLEQLIAALNVRRSRVKPVAAVAAERLGRLKPNGRLRSYSPLSRLVELDALVLALDTKRLLWQSLRDARIAGSNIDIDSLIARAERRRRALEPHRSGQAARALGTA
jgi:hypothetical protein